MLRFDFTQFFLTSISKKIDCKTVLMFNFTISIIRKLFNCFCFCLFVYHLMLLFEFLQYDEEKYPELYRKSNEYIKGNNDGIAQPYLIGNVLLLLSYLKKLF